MPFTISSSISNNSAGTGSVDIEVSPSAAIFSPTALVPGESLGSPQLNVENTGDVDAYYFIFADWRADGTTSAAQAQILADKLNISIADGSANSIYDGPISGLIEQPTGGRLLAPNADEDLTFVVSLPSDAGNVVQGADLAVDLIFVSQASPLSP